MKYRAVKKTSRSSSAANNSKIEFEETIHITKADLERAIVRVFDPSLAWGSLALERLARELGFK